MAKKKKKKKWLQKARSSMKKRGTVGSFTAWCKRKGFKGVTNECVAMGKRSSNKVIRRKANFAANVRKISKGRKKKK